MLRILVKTRVKSGFYKPPAEARIDRPGYACMANAGSTTEEHVQRHAPLVTDKETGTTPRGDHEENTGEPYGFSPFRKETRTI